MEQNNENNEAGGASEKVVFRASSGDFEITESSPSKRDNREKQQDAKKAGGPNGNAGKGKPPSKKASSSKKKKPVRYNKKGKKKRRLWWIWVVILLLLLASLGTAAYVFADYVLDEYVKATYNYYMGPDEILASLAPHTYEVSTLDEAILYLTHPSLNEGDTIIVYNDFIIDIDEVFGGFLSFGLVNFDCSGGSITFTGGTVVLVSGRQEAVTMNGVAFNGTNLFIDASEVDLYWKEALRSAAVNVKTINGTPSLNADLVIPAPGGRMTIPVTLRNLTSSAQNDIEIQFISPSFLFLGGPVKVSIPAGGSQTVDADVIVTEGGRARIFAVGKGPSGEKIIDGYSEFIELLGGGYYSGDPHTHSQESYTDRSDSTIEKNIFYAAEKGHSFIISVENDIFAEKLSQQEVDSIVGGSGTFLQLTALETGRKNELRHILLYNYGSDLIPRSDYEVSDFRRYVLQEAIWTAQEEDPETIIYIPHPFGYGVDIANSLSNISSLYGIRGIEILDQTSFSDWNEFIITINIWNNINIYDRQRVFGIGSSNNIFSEYVGSRYTKGYMTYLSEENIYKMLREGNMFASNGPELRFTLDDAQMGEDLFVRPGDTMTARIYASSETPLTSVKLIRYDVDGSWETLNPDYVLDMDLKGKNVYEYKNVVSVEVPTNVNREGEEIVQKSFYRLEVRSESSPYYEDVGLAFGNPIWVSSDGEAMGSCPLYTEVKYEENPPAQIFGLDFDLSMLDDRVEKRILDEYGEAFGGAQLYELDNGDYYILGNFTVNALYAIPKEESHSVRINYHRYNSNVIPDKVTIVTSVPGQLMRSVKTVYLLD